MKPTILGAAMALGLATAMAHAGEMPAASNQGAMSPASLELAFGDRDFCVTCQSEKVSNNRYTCWNVKTGNEFFARVQADVICARNFGLPMYRIGEGACSTKRYCKTIK